MATFRTFCYNPSPNPAIPGTEQVGDIAASSNILTIQTLLSKPSGQQVTAAECKVIIDKYTQRIKEALSY